MIDLCRLKMIGEFGVVELSEKASIFYQGNTMISVTRPPTKTKQKRDEREREKREK